MAHIMAIHGSYLPFSSHGPQWLLVTVSFHTTSQQTMVGRHQVPVSNCAVAPAEVDRWVQALLCLKKCSYLFSFRF